VHANSALGRVTFAETLDMATGHFRSREFEADEDAADFLLFQQFEDHADRIDFACTHYPFKLAPGTAWVYHTTDSYLLARRSMLIIEASRDPVPTFHRLMAPQFWAPLHLSPAVAVPRRTRDLAAEPFTAFGMTLLRDDVAKLAEFINGDRGSVGGEQKLEPLLLDEALQRAPGHQGLAAPGLALPARFLGLECAGCVWVSGTHLDSLMSGYGGITVALMPNGMNYYYFSDGGAFSWARRR